MLEVNPAKFLVWIPYDKCCHSLEANQHIAVKLVLRWLFIILGAMVLPFVIVTVYLMLAGNGSQRSGSVDIAILILSVTVGVASVASGPIDRLAKLISSIAYIPVMGFVLIDFAFRLMCSLYRDCM